jgi:Tol biopolymer transport system component
MTDQLERELPTALARLGADEPAPVDVAGRALRRARRTAAVRLTTATAAIAGVTAAAIFTGTALTGGQPTPAGSGVASTGRGTPGRDVPGAAGLRVVSAYSCNGVAVDNRGRTLAQHSLLLDRATGRFTRVSYCDVLPSPDGTRALVRAGNGGVTHPGIGVLDVASRQVRWITGYDGVGAWSPDSRRIVLTGGPTGLSQTDSTRPENNGIVLVDARTAQVQSFSPIAGRAADGLGSYGVWTPDGNAIAFTVCPCPPGSTHEGPWPIIGIRLYDLHGHAIRTLPANRGLWTADAFSPDGSRMVLTTENQVGGPVQIADTRTGSVTRTVALPAGNMFLGWYDRSHLVTLAGVTDRHRTGQFPLQLIDLSGRVTRTVPLPAVESLLDNGGPDQGTIRIGSADGLPAHPTAPTF